MEPFLFDADQLLAVADAHAEQYAAAQPFPHVVLDGLVPEWVLDTVVAEFPPADNMELHYDTRNDYKSASQDVSRWGPFTRQVMAEFNAAPFLQFVMRLTGIEKLISDPYYDGGGLHQTVGGGKLGVHTDFSKHATLWLDRRVNALVYLNREWDPAWGGVLELWDRNMTECVATVTPAFGRMLVFNTNDFSFHGHPEPMTPPPGVTRRSLALYYYSNGRPASDLAGEPHGTQFRQRPGSRDLSFSQRAKLVGRDVLPPAVFRRIQKMRGYGENN